MVAWGVTGWEGGSVLSPGRVCYWWSDLRQGPALLTSLLRDWLLEGWWVPRKGLGNALGRAGTSAGCYSPPEQIGSYVLGARGCSQGLVVNLA